MQLIARGLTWTMIGCLTAVSYPLCASQTPSAPQAQPSNRRIAPRSSGLVSFLTPQQTLLLAARESAYPISIFGSGGKAELYPETGSGCGHSHSGADLYGDSPISAKNDETLRRLGLCGFNLWAWNQQNQAANKKNKKKKPYSPSATYGSPGHIFWVEPAYKADYLHNFKPLTPREKFNEWAQAAYDPLGFGVVAFEAATLEHTSSDGFCGYGHGAGAYGKCFGSMEADSNISSFVGDFVLPVILHQDPRYFRLGQGSFGRRAWYAISRVFITHSDSGKWVFYSSALSGTVLAAAASNLYYPPQDRGFGASVSRAGIDLGDTAIFNLAAEFWPDIKTRVYHTFRIHRASP
jgi:hypothetical protein